MNPDCRVLNRPRGFTLIEVLAAVAVLAIALSAVLASAASFTDNAVYLRDKALASLVARNVLVEYSLAVNWPEPGRKQGESDMGRETWPWEAVVQKTDDPDLRRVDVLVFRPGSEDRVAILTGFLGPPAPAASSAAGTTGVTLPGQ